MDTLFLTVRAVRGSCFARPVGGETKEFRSGPGFLVTSRAGRHSSDSSYNRVLELVASSGLSATVAARIQSVIQGVRDRVAMSTPTSTASSAAGRCHHACLCQAVQGVPLVSHFNGKWIRNIAFEGARDWCYKAAHYRLQTQTTDHTHRYTVPCTH